MTLAILLAALALGQTPAQSAARKVTEEFDRVGRTAPLEDSRLDQAASRIAKKALTLGAQRAADPLSIAQAVSGADAYDPSPRALLVRADPPLVALDTFRARTDLGQDPAGAMGIAFESDGVHGVVALLLVQRKARLEPFPRALPKAGVTQALCGQLVRPLGQPEIYVTAPSGDVERTPPRKTDDGFCADLRFAHAGRHTIELIGTGPSGPEVAALFFVDVGASAPEEDATLTQEPAGAEEARAEILRRINALRLAHHEGTLTADSALDRIAQAYSERMAKEHFFAHLDPSGKNLRQRLLEGGYPYGSAGENLGLAEGPLAAHFGIELSPGHRKNLLQSDFTRLGVGIAQERVDGREQTVVTEILARPVEPAKDPLQQAYQVLGAQRATLHLPPLSRSTALEPLARAQASFALKTDFPEAKLPGPSISDRVFATDPATRRASMDLFITGDVGSLPTSKSLADARNDRIAVAVVKGNSPTFGPDKFWVVVIYAGPN